MDMSAPTTPLIMDPFNKSCTSPANAFEFDFGGNFFNGAEEDDLLSSLYNKNQTQTNTDVLFDNNNTFSSLSNIINEKSLPDSPDSWVSNSSMSDNDCEDLELCEFTSELNVQKTTEKTTSKKNKTKQQKQPPIMTGALPPTFLPNMQMNFPMQYQQGMMDPYQLATGMMPMPMMSPQQLLFLQQQQQAFSTFNAMNFQPTNFVPAPVPPKATAKKPTSPVVKVERSSPKAASPIKASTLKRRRDSNTSPLKEDGKKSPVDVSDTGSNNSTPTSSPSSSPTPSHEGNGPKPKEKDVKRQRRLIKNRESAQASRERKKVYVQGLEKRVDDLAQTNNALNSKVLTLEEENILLREKLLSMDQDGSIFKELNEPSFKKRRIGGQQKIPIPSLQTGNSMNPFANGFWNAFMSFAPPHTQTNNNNASGWNTGTQSKKVVLFVMLFCVAVLVMSSNKGEEGAASAPFMTTNQDSTSITVSQDVLNRNSISRKLLNMNDAMQSFVEQFASINNTLTDEGKEEDEEEAEGEKKEGTTTDDSSSDYSIEYNKDKDSLVLTFPVASLKKEPGTQSKKDLQMDKLTKELLSTLCNELKK